MSSEEPSRIGSFLLQEGLITQTELEESLSNQRIWKDRLGQVLIGMGILKRKDFYRTLAKYAGLEYSYPPEEKIDEELIRSLPFEWMQANSFIPLRQTESTVFIATSEPTNDRLFDLVLRRFKKEVSISVASEFSIDKTLARIFEKELMRQTNSKLTAVSPEFSAKATFEKWPIKTFAVFIFGTFLLAFLFPFKAALVVNANIQIVYLLSILFKLYATGVGLFANDKEVSQKAHDSSEDDLPIYTVLIPVYKEKEVLPHLLKSIRALDYPKSKLDVKILMEEDDRETLEAAMASNMEDIFEFIVVPNFEPRTKPKACNWGLFFARGAIVTIYDAEDEPEPDQLKKIVEKYKKVPRETFCIQARLNYYNPYENFMTRMFTLEYTYWFDCMLPGLEKMKIPIPLGGTSNHFLRSRLRQLGGWDAYNVTEDADLGVRASRMGYSVSILNSTTMEEANKRVGNWIKQRTRWIKGYMLTFFVHLKKPITLYTELGLRGFIGFFLFIGGTPFTFLVNPLLWIVFLLWVIFRLKVLDALFPPWLITLGVFTLIAGNSFIIIANILAAWHRGLYRLIPWALLSPIYWLFHSIAAWRALFQVIMSPFSWEKTQHGISNQKRA